MGKGIVVSVELELTLDVLIRSTCTVTVGITALDHKAGNDAVEGQSVVKAFGCKGNEVSYSFGSEVGVKLKGDLTVPALRQAPHKQERRQG